MDEAPFGPECVVWVDPDDVVHETLEGETIVVALKTGVYYSITGSGVDMWTVITEPVRYADAVAYLQARFPDEGHRVAEQFSTWLAELEAEELVTVRADGGASGPVRSPEPASYEPPVLARYTDMQSLILLDPVHEADVETGWPNRR